MGYNPNNPNGQATAAASQPVVLASDQAALPLSTGAATSTKQSDGTQKTRITDGTNDVTNKLLSVQVAGTDYGLVTNTVIHGLTTAGGGTYVDVKVNPSGALSVDSSGSTATVTGTVTANAGTNLNTSALALAATQTDKSQFTKITDGTDTALVTAAGEQNVIATAQPGVDIGDVTINNSTGASAVNIQDGGNSITVDAPVATPVFVRLSDGAAAITTLPVSLASAPTTAVTGTFWQATQPVSGTFWQATQPVSIATAPVLVAGSAIIGKVGIDQTTPGTTNGVQVNAALPAGTNAIGKLAANSGVDIGDVDVTSIVMPTLTKGTQGSTGLSVQNLKDAGRTSIMITATVTSTATSETLITITRSQGLAATGTGTSTTITSGKKLRIQAIVASARNSTGTTAGVATIRIRGAVGGATSASSPLQYTSSVALPAAATSVLFPSTGIPDGFEIDSNSGTNTYGVTILHPQWVTGSVVATFDISIIGYEY